MSVSKGCFFTRFGDIFRHRKGSKAPEVIKFLKYSVCNPSGASIEARPVYSWPNWYGYFF